MRASGPSSPNLPRKVFLTGLAFFAVMLAMSGTIAWTLADVTRGTTVLLEGVERESGYARALQALERTSAAEHEARRSGSRAVARAAHADLGRAVAGLGGDATAVQPVIRAHAAWRQGGGEGAERAARQALAAYEAAALAQAREAKAVMEPRIRTAWRLGGLRALLAIAFFVFLGWYQYRLLSRTFAAYIAELEGRTRQVDEMATALAAQNEDLERRVADRTRELAEARDHAQHAYDAKSAFLANFSHEMRTPLNAIIGYSELISEELQPHAFAGKAEAVADLQRVRGAGKHLLGLIDDVLDLAKADAGKLEPALEPVDLRALVGDVVDVARPLAAKRGNDLVVTMDAPYDPVVTDPKMLRQSLFNLVANACKFTEHGRIDLVVRLAADELTCEVADTGIGMTAAQLERLFQDYSQADASITRKYGGTGLGLAISQRFCRLLGGELEVASEPGRGSTFTLRVPARAAAPVAPTA